MTAAVISPQAERDLEEIADFIAADSPARALSFVQEIRQHCDRIGTSPLAYAARPDLGHGIRACPHGSYIIIFHVHSPTAPVLIVRILNAARDLRRLFGSQS
jgi:toxin ParE1/3/4